MVAVAVCSGQCYVAVACWWQWPVLCDSGLMVAVASVM